MPNIARRKGICLKEKYKQEFQDEKNNITHHYIKNKDELDRFQLHYDDNGFFTTADNQPAHGLYLYVRTLDGNIYAAIVKDKIHTVEHHSYLSCGENVLSTGYFFFQRGKMFLVSNESGHYTPTNEEMLPEIDFYYQIAKNEYLIYEDHSNFPQSALIYQYRAKDLINQTSVKGAPVYEIKAGRDSDYVEKKITQQEQPLPYSERNVSLFFISSQNNAQEERFEYDYMLAKNSNYLPDHQLPVSPPCGRTRDDNVTVIATP